MESINTSAAAIKSPASPPTAPIMPCGIEHPDADIIFAWEHRKAAYDAYNLLPHSEVAGENYTTEEREQLAIIDECEDVIKRTEARTPRGAELQLWASLSHLVHGAEMDAAANRADYDFVVSHEDLLDWELRLILSSIRALRAMTEAQHQFADAWLALWTEKGGSVHLEPIGKAQIGFPTYDLSRTYEKMAHRYEGVGADHNQTWDDGHYYGAMNAMYAALTAHPGGAAMVKARMRDKGISFCMLPKGEAA